MTIAGIDPKCYILALFVRDDGVRFLLGDDPYEFKDKQLHFQPNTVANDVVEVQGNDGYLLAGQVRRPGTQSFDGYVCNGTNSKAEVEVKRREFLQFFRRSHFYKVIYVFPNGMAIQRKQGFLVDDPTVQELYQQYPEYHVALNFEDVNYYTYEEDDQGQEIYAKEAIVPLAGGGATGGLIWDEYGVVWEEPWSDLVSVSGSEIQIDNEAGARAPIQDLELQGDTYQQTYSGKNLLEYASGTSENGITTVVNNDGSLSLSISGKPTKTWAALTNNFDNPSLDAGTYTFCIDKTLPFNIIFRTRVSNTGEWTAWDIPAGSKSVTTTLSGPQLFSYIYISRATVGEAIAQTVKIQLVAGSTPDYDFEPYIGGIPAPNPDYPQDIQTVTGRQVVAVTGGDGESAEYEINLGKNLFDKDNIRIFNGYFEYSGDVIHASPANRVFYIPCEPNAAYSFTQGPTSVSNHIFQVATTAETPATGVTVSKFLDAGASNVQNYITASDAKYIVVGIRSGDDTPTFWDGVQIERGSTISSYAPYFTPIELCKIGDYRDEIFNNDPNEDWYDPDLEDNAWYVHKETGKSVFDGDQTETWRQSGAYNAVHNIQLADILPADNNNRPYQSKIYCDHFTLCDAGYNGGYLSPSQNGTTAVTSDKYLSFNYSQTTSIATWTAWLRSNNVSAYYPISTPTDTKITDATLVGQLEALGAMKLFIGENNVLVSTPTPNLPATLAFDYYTKFAAIGAEWEEGGTKGATIVDVNAIDNTYPVWELMGPAVNPTISVLTTNTTLTYNGTITASQKLVIDMFNKTATLNGTSVIGNVSGDFVYMAPGTNRIAYTAENTDAPDSTIYWQEVVG